MFSQPFLKMGELDCAGFDQGAGDKTAYPVVVHTKGQGYGPMLAHPRFNIIPGIFNAFFYIHVLTL